MTVTEIINEKQQRIAGLLIRSFRTNYNSEKYKIKSNAIIQKLRDRKLSCGDAELREIIGHIRRNDLCSPGFILSDSGGYWYSENETEMKKVWQSNHGRAIEIMKNFQPLHKRFRHLVSEQDSMFNKVCQ